MKITLKILHEVPNKSSLRFMTWAGIWKRAVDRQKQKSRKIAFFWT